MLFSSDLVVERCKGLLPSAVDLCGLWSFGRLFHFIIYCRKKCRTTIHITAW